MQVLSYGYLLPETGDDGTPLFDALEGDIQQLNDHTHNGINSAFLPAQSIPGVNQTISSASWVANGPTGFYRQLVTMIAGFSFDTTVLRFQDPSGSYIVPTVEKQSATSFYVYTIDNSINFTAVYR